jgi:glycosyltransferase involved in cell wall biosynthesis
LEGSGGKYDHAGRPAHAMNVSVEMNTYNRKLRIAFIGTKGLPAKWGGIEKYIEEIGRRLVRRGHAVTVFCSKWYCADYAKNTYLGMRIYRVPAIHLKATDALTNAFWATIAISKGKYDIVNFHGYASYFFAPVVGRTGKKTVVTAHGVESGWDNPKYGFFARKIIQQAFRIGLTRADRVTTVANHLKATIKEKFDIDARVLPSGLDDVAVQPAAIIKQKYSLKGSDYLLFLGRIDPIKRVDWLLDIPSGLKQNIKIVIAGGPQDSTTEMYYHDLIRKSKYLPDVIFTGAVSGIEKAELLSNCLMFLAPSSYEGLPITVLEAMAYARCCVASQIPAHCEVVEDGATGFLFPKNDKKAFVRLVNRLIAKPKDYIVSIGDRAKKRAADKLNWDKTSILYEQLFWSLFDEKTKSRKN